jgi:TRAP-type C4-dicarboxylate transport system permease large subunit
VDARRLAHVNIIGSVIFAACRHGDCRCGRLGHDRDQGHEGSHCGTEFSVGVTAASATLGPIIPPSLPFVITA